MPQAYCQTWHEKHCIFALSTERTMHQSLIQVQHMVLISLTALYSHISGIISIFLTCSTNTRETKQSLFCFQLTFEKEQRPQPLFTS